MVQKLFVLAAAIGWSGCMPYAVPPLTGGVGASRTAESSRTGFHAELGVAPLQFLPSRLNRAWDASVSGTFDRAWHDAWGAALAAGPVLHPWEGLEGRRVVPQLAGRWGTDRRAAAVRLTLETAAFVDSAEDGGRSYGEAAIGGYVEAGYEWPDRADERWAVMLGLTIRLPAATGLACCLRL